MKRVSFSVLVGLLVIAVALREHAAPGQPPSRKSAGTKKGAKGATAGTAATQAFPTPAEIDAQLAQQMLATADKNGDKKLSRAELMALADAWFAKLDPEKLGK